MFKRLAMFIRAYIIKLAEVKYNLQSTSDWTESTRKSADQLKVVSSGATLLYLNYCKLASAICPFKQYCSSDEELLADSLPAPEISCS